jgi:hypothetical protein
VKEQPIDYYRRREQAEREAARNASCERARWAHEQMADACARRVELEELKAAGERKVVSFADAQRLREDAEYGRYGLPFPRARLA